MSTNHSLVAAEQARGAPASQIGGSVWYEAWVDKAAAAAMNERLSRLSDAELRHRGLSHYEARDHSKPSDPKTLTFW